MDNNNYVHQQVSSPNTANPLIIQQQRRQNQNIMPNQDLDTATSWKNEERTQAEEETSTSFRDNLLDTLALKMKALLIPGEVVKKKEVHPRKQPKQQHKTKILPGTKSLRKKQSKHATQRKKSSTKKSLKRSMGVESNVQKSPNEINLSNQSDTKNSAEDELFWSEASVRVSAAIIKAGGTLMNASTGQLAVLNASKDAPDTSAESLNLVSAKLSSSLLAKRVDHSIAAAGAIACLNRDFKEGDDAYINKEKLMKVYGEANDMVKNLTQKGVETGSNILGKGFEIAQNQIKQFDDTLDNYAQEREVRWRARRDKKNANLHLVNPVRSPARSPPKSPVRNPSRSPSRSPARSLPRSYGQRDVYDKKIFDKNAIRSRSGSRTRDRIAVLDSFDDVHSRYHNRSSDFHDSSGSGSTTSSQSIDTRNRDRTKIRRNLSESSESSTSLSRTKQSASNSLTNSSASMSQSVSSQSTRSRNNRRSKKKKSLSRRSSLPSSSGSDSDSESSQNSEGEDCTSQSSSSSVSRKGRGTTKSRIPRTTKRKGRGRGRDIIKRTSTSS